LLLAVQFTVAILSREFLKKKPDMTTIPLDGSWQLLHFKEGQHPGTRLHTGQPGDWSALNETIFEAQVPGNVELDLVRSGALPEPYHGSSIRQLRSLETHEWWYARSFAVPAEPAGTRWALVFEGLDTLATVWLNGEQVGQSDNMLVEQRFEVTGGIRPGAENRLVVRLGSALNHARTYEYEAAAMSWEHREEGLYVRKAPHVWGWDILPRAVSAGIWRPVRLETIPDSAIEQLYYYTLATSTSQAGSLHEAVLGVRFQFRTSDADLDGFRLCFHGECGDHSFDFEWPVEFLAGGCSIPVPGAKLWWPKGYGEPSLYTITARLYQGDRLVAARTDRVGIRKLQVERTELAGRPHIVEPAASGQSRIDTPPDPQSCFVFYVNGEPIQVRGTNWVPLDAFHSRDMQRVDAAVAMADDLHCNMIRCWGGNVYESERFFDLCDEKGILVWQDFAFACNRYPQDASFLARVRAEAEAVIKRLRSHACLAIWCGDNEIDMAYLTQGLSPEHNHLTREVLPQVIQRMDPHRAYVPSSPYAPPSVTSQPDPFRATPEQHLWGPRGYFKSPFYTQHSAHFIGEIGYHGCPGPASLRRFLTPEHLWPWQNNDEWQVHAVYHWNHPAVDRDRIKLMASQVKELFGGVPDDLESFALASQITQAEAKKFFIESTRARKWDTSGLLWWNLIDGWPQFSDAVVDYYFEKKLAYHYIWRSQRPVMVMLGEPGSGKYLPVIACNDTLRPAALHFRVWDADSGECSAEGDIHVPPNQAWQADRIRVYTSDQRMFLIEWRDSQEPGQPVYANHYLAGTPPFSLDRYRAWLGLIAGMNRPFRVS
jgi:beta-mannosidase